MKRSALGIAACAAIVLTCALAPAQASATVLCNANTTPCPVPYGAGTQIQAALPAMTTTVIESALGNVTCLENKIKMKSTAEGGSGLSVPVRVSELVFGQCTIPAGGGGTESCTVTAVNLGPLEEEQWIGFFEKGVNGNGAFSITMSELGSFGFSVFCKGKVECTLTAVLNSTVTGGLGGAATITGAQKMSRAGAKCPPADPTWKFKWNVSEPANFFLVAE